MRSTPMPPLNKSSSKKRRVSKMTLNASKHVSDNGMAGAGSGGPPTAGGPLTAGPTVGPPATAGPTGAGHNTQHHLKMHIGT